MPGFRPAFASDDYLVQWRAMETGAGAMVLARFPQPLERATPLETLDVDLGMHASSNIHLVSTRSALDISRVRAVADLLVAALERLGPRVA